MNIPENYLHSLTDAQKKAVEAAKTPEELLAIAQEAGFELSQDQLDAIAGGKGSWCSKDTCPDYCYEDCGIVRCIL